MAAALPLLAGIDPAEVKATLSDLREMARRAGSKLKFEFGLDGDPEAMGWKLLAALGWESWELYIGPPVKMAWHIEQQVAGVLQALYGWLGGVGKAVDAGAADIEKAVVSAAEDVYSWVVSL
jgi:hypothetical protein